MHINDPNQSAVDPATAFEHASVAVDLTKLTHLASLAQTLWDLFWTMSPTGQMLDAESWAAFTGQSIEEASGSGWIEALHPDDRSGFDLWLLQIFQARKKAEFECRVQQASGDYRWLRVQCAPLPDSDEWLACGCDITDLKQTKEWHLEASTILDGLPDTFVHLDRNWNYTYINQAAERVMRRPRAEALGRNFFEIYPEAKYYDFVKQYRKAIETQQPVHFTSYYAPSQCWYTCHTYPDKDGGISIYSSNINEIRRTEQALQTTERNFQRLVESNLIGIVRARMDGQILEANDAFLSLLGYSQAEFMAGELYWQVFTSPESLEPSYQAIEELKRTGCYTSFEKNYIRKDGKLVTVLLAGTLLEEGGDEYIAYVVDITIQKEMDQQKDAFIGVISHELRTPLTAIKGNIQLVKRQLRALTRVPHSLPQGIQATIVAAEERIGRALHQIEVQNRLINDLLDVSRIAANKLELSPQLCDITRIVRNNAEDIQATAMMRTINLQLPEYDTVLVMADPDRVGQVISNYITNALKYSDINEPITVGMDIEATKVRIWVTDRGPGLNAEERKQVWNRFYQSRHIPVRSGSGMGLGLGLYICQTLIKRLDGDVGVDSVPGQGSTFWFTLPLM